MSATQIEPDNEFARVAAYRPGAASLPGGGQSAVRRAWVNVATGGHLSAVVWGTAQPEIVLLHDARRSARAWDEVALEIGRPVVAIDLPGHGRSNWRRDGRYEPRKLAPAVAEAIRSFAPRARLVAGEGLGGLTALALAQRQPALLPAVVLVDTLPAADSAGTDVGAILPTSRPVLPSRVPQPRTAESAVTSPGFATPEEARAALADSHPGWPDTVLRQEVRTELDAEPDGRWAWRHHPGNLPEVVGQAFGDPSLWTELAGLGAALFVIRAEESARLAEADLDVLNARAPLARVITIPGVTELPVEAPAALAARLLDLLAAANRPAQASSILADR
jgi:pimeloyl-ACP methyl ester carboxylesterase